MNNPPLVLYLQKKYKSADTRNLKVPKNQCFGFYIRKMGLIIAVPRSVNSIKK